MESVTRTTSLTHHTKMQAPNAKRRRRTPRPSLSTLPRGMLNIIFTMLTTVEHIVLEGTCKELRHVGQAVCPMEEMQWRLGHYVHSTVANKRFIRIAQHRVKRLLFHTGRFTPNMGVVREGHYRHRDLQLMMMTRRTRWRLHQPNVTTPARPFTVFPSVKTLTIAANNVSCVAEVTQSLPNMETLILPGVTAVADKVYYYHYARNLKHLAVYCTSVREIRSARLMLLNLPALTHLTCYFEPQTAQNASDLFTACGSSVREITTTMDALMAALIVGYRTPPNIQAINIDRKHRWRTYITDSLVHGLRQQFRVTATINII